MFEDFLTTYSRLVKLVTNNKWIYYFNIKMGYNKVNKYSNYIHQV